MSTALFILVVAVSFTVVRTGAIAFQLPGLHWPQARFQALSCFTGTGFTTRESELIVGDSLLCFGKPEEIRDVLLRAR